MALLGDLGSTNVMEDGSKLSPEVLKGRKEWSAVASTTVRRWSSLELSCEIKCKNQGGAISILKLT